MHKIDSDTESSEEFYDAEDLTPNRLSKYVFNVIYFYLFYYVLCN